MRIRLLLLISILSGTAGAESNLSQPIANSTLIGGGCIVSVVNPGSPAEGAGINVGDVILNAGGAVVHSVDDLRQILGAASSEISLDLRRAGKTDSLTVKLDSGKRGPRLGIQCNPMPSDSSSLDPEASSVTAPATTIPIVQPSMIKRTPNGPMDAAFQNMNMDERVILTMKDGSSRRGAFEGYAKEGESVYLNIRSGLFLFKKTILLDDIQTVKQN